MTPKEKAKEFYDKFHVYDWDEEMGYIPSDLETKAMCYKVIEEIENQSKNWGAVPAKTYWDKVKQEIRKL